MVPKKTLSYSSIRKMLKNLRNSGWLKLLLSPIWGKNFWTNVIFDSVVWNRLTKDVVQFRATWVPGWLRFSGNICGGGQSGDHVSVEMVLNVQPAGRLIIRQLLRCTFREIMWWIYYYLLNTRLVPCTGLPHTAPASVRRAVRQFWRNALNHGILESS